jgi:hypothetical protein
MAKRKQPRRIWRRRVWPSRWVPTEPKGDLWIAPSPRRVRLWTNPDPLSEITGGIDGITHELHWVM